MTYESIPNEKKNLTITACKTLLSMLSTFTVTDKTYDTSITLYNSFVHEILSLPTILRYLTPQLNLHPLPYKLIFQAYYYSKRVDDQATQEEEKHQGQLMGEMQKDERKMFIFANTFELMHTRLMQELNSYEIYPVL